MLGFRQMKTLQKFSSGHAAFHNHFNQDRRLISKRHTKLNAQPPWLSRRRACGAQTVVVSWWAPGVDGVNRR